MIKGVLFDLDGTLTQPVLDFDRIREEMAARGLPVNGPILESLEHMSDAQRHLTEAILHHHELQAAENALLNPGAYETWRSLRGQMLGLACITRNRRLCVERVCQRYRLVFDTIITRDDGPVKPDPFPVELACRNLGLKPSETILIGDYLFDLQSARQAGARAVLLTTHENYSAFIPYADAVIDTLWQLEALIAGLNRGP